MTDKLTEIINSKHLSRYTKLALDDVREIAEEFAASEVERYQSRQSLFSDHIVYMVGGVTKVVDLHSVSSTIEYHNDIGFTESKDD